MSGVALRRWTFTVTDGGPTDLIYGPFYTHADFATLQAERDALRAQVPIWIPCSERMPEHKQDVLFFRLDSVQSGYYVDADRGHPGCFIGRHTYWNTTGRVTHWMPLPKPLALQATSQQENTP